MTLTGARVAGAGASGGSIFEHKKGRGCAWVLCGVGMGRRGLATALVEGAGASGGGILGQRKVGERGAL